MPTITIRRRELARLAGRQMSDQALEEALPLAKGELKGVGEDGDELRIELNDSNRPDLWCVEGIARQIRLFDQRDHGMEKLFARPRRRKGQPLAQVRVDSAVLAVRPFLGACIARDVRVDAHMLDQLIQTQEKLAEIFGQKRRSLSIGYYRLDALQFPLTYTAVKPTAGVFVPLGMDRPLTLEAILDEHPKGQEYGHLVREASRYPYFIDAGGQPLSFPPITNSRELGEVRDGDRNLLVEVTGTDLRLVVLLINLLAANLLDRGATIEPVEVVYPEPTIYGKRVVMPYDGSKPVLLRRGDVETVLGNSLTDTEVIRLLRQAGHRVKRTTRGWQVTPPPFRGDVMHSVDLIEDLAMMRGYDRIEPELPKTFTVGSLSPQARFEGRVREWMVGLGFQEVLSNVLCSKSDLLEKMGLEEPVVEVENALSLQYAVLRHWLMPSLLRVEAASGHAFYPHRMFEVGEVTTRSNGGERHSRQEFHLAALWAAPLVAFSELHSILELLMVEAGVAYRLQPATHPSFLDGRAGQVLIDERHAGWIGELHPAVLERWKISMPCVGWGIDLSPLQRAVRAEPL